jgi:Mg2+-importing ATPase
MGTTPAVGSYWSRPPAELIGELGSSPEGLTTAQAQAALGKFGPNQIRAKSHTSPLGLFLDQFKSPIVLILLFATLLSAFLKDWADAIIILIIVLASALLSFYQEYNADHAAEGLRKQLTLNAQVLRDGQLQSIPVEGVVPGDIVSLSAGSLIPADGIVLETNDFFVNQAVLTGETFPVEKSPGPIAATASLAERTNTVFMGTNARSGTARTLVVQTGTSTAFGQIAKRLTLRPPETEFERGIRRLGYLLTEVMFVLVLLIFAINVLLNRSIMDSLLFSIALAVGLTPQLLPAIVNINLSRGSQAMAKAGVIVRRLESIENFGSMDVLCTDKTGTLTVGVTQLDKAVDAEGQPSEQLLRLAGLNARFQTGLPNPLDEAILAKAFLEPQAFLKVDEIPYDFTRKRLTVIVRSTSQDLPGDWMITKGALDNVLEVCSQAQIEDQQVQLDAGIRDQIKQRYTGWSDKGYRVLGTAMKTVTDDRPAAYSREDERDLIFAGFLLFSDPPKPGVKETIQHLEQLGIRLKVITGDNHLVGRYVAQEVGLGGGEVLTGAQLDDMHDEALWNAAERTVLFAEVDPNQKERIILALKKTGHVVGYMGDGINDAPSLHSADVGISVDNAVDVAKEAADFVLLRQDLEVLKQGILEGRKTFANTLKYVFMATSANFGNMFSVAIASLFLPFLPMLPKQILLINFMTDLPEFTISGDNVDKEFLERPHRWDVSFIRRFMLVFGPLSSIFDLLTFAVLLWLLHADQTLFHTGWFVESVISASLVVFALRTRLPVLKSLPSKTMLAVTLLVALATLVIPYSPLAKPFSFEPLPLPYLLAIGAVILVYFLSAEVAKRWFFQRYEP